MTISRGTAARHLDHAHAARPACRAQRATRATRRGRSRVSRLKRLAPGIRDDDVGHLDRWPAEPLDRHRCESGGHRTPGGLPGTEMLETAGTSEQVTGALDQDQHHRRHQMRFEAKYWISKGQTMMDATWCFILGTMIGFIPCFAALTLIVVRMPAPPARPTRSS
jgi:hypothetical protein